MCKDNYFILGESITLLEVLSAREARQNRQEELAETFPKDTILSITMNTPGPIKTNETLITVHTRFIKDLLETLTDGSVLEHKSNFLNTGLETYIVVKQPSLDLKKEMVKFEETHPYGRMFDVDVIESLQTGSAILSRKDIGVAPRTCYICTKDAKECGRARTHSVEELQIALTERIKEGREILNG